MTLFKEGLNPLYYLGGLIILTAMARKFSSIRFFKVYRSINRVKRELEARLTTELEGPLVLSFDDLRDRRLLKDKYTAYASFLAAISSYPILHRVAGEDAVESSIFSKTAMMTGIKLLDNVNDQFHDFEQAEASQQKYEEALTKPLFFFDSFEGRKPWLARAENSAYTITRWAYQRLPTSLEDSKTFKIFIADVREFVDAQIRSFYQKSNLYNFSGLSFKDYLRKVTAKASGTLWVDVDLCFYEASTGGLDGATFKSLECVNRGIDLLFRALIIWDDVTDLKDDLRDSIVNSAMMLGLETGKVSPSELQGKAVKVIKTLEERGVLEDAIHLGNLVFLSAVEQMREAENLNENIDVEALIYCARVLRLFLLRKQVEEKKDLRSIRLVLRSFDEFERFRSDIPDYLRPYGKLVIS